MFEFIDAESINYYKKLESKVLFLFETPWSEECESFLNRLVECEGCFNDTPVYRVELDLDGGQYLTRKFNIETAPTLLLFEGGQESKRITHENFLYELI